MGNKRIVDLPQASTLSNLLQEVCGSDGVSKKTPFKNPEEIVSSVSSGLNVEVDNTDPLNPIVNGLKDVELDSIVEKTVNSGIKLLSPLRLFESEQVLSGAGVITAANQTTRWIITGANAATLSDGVLGQIKLIYNPVNAGVGTLQPAGTGLFSSIDFNVSGSSALLYFSFAGWVVISTYGCTVTP